MNRFGKISVRRAVALCTGADFWTTRANKKLGIPPLRMSDGPHGLRVQERGGGFGMLGVKPARPATCFPTAVTLANSWNTELLAAVGRCIGEEALSHGVGLVLGPGVNIKRSPLCGRNFEYYSEDPYLSGKLAAAFIRALEATGASACVKHFAVNSQERDRLSSDSVADERTLREIYLPAFELAVREGKPGAVMCAYNRLNGVYCSDNRKLLTDLLRGEWGFGGMVVTDWGAMHDRTEAFRAGCDLNMPGGHHYGERDAVRAVKRGGLDRGYVDRSLERIASLARRAQASLQGTHVFDAQAHHEAARRAACEGSVLLKNDGGMLPLRPGTRIAVIGDMARNMRYQGSGSSHITPMRLCQPVDSLPYSVYAQGCDAEGGTTDELLASAAAAARDAEAAIVFAGLPDSYESEGFDREHMRLPDGVNRLINTVAAANENTCVVLFAGSPVECPWADSVRAVLYMGLPGQTGGEAAADLLYGRAEPSGRLAESWPREYSDCPVSDTYSMTRDALYTEGVYVGYRYYATANVPVRWPFGHGLSYSSFEYSDMCPDAGGVRLTVTNTGRTAASEVVQLYVAPPRGRIHRPALELRGFEKIRLAPGESREVRFALTERAFALWQGGWRVFTGDYTLCAGASSADLRARVTVHIDGETEPEAPEWQAGSWYERLSGKPKRSEWEAMLGREYVPYVPRKGSFTMNDTPYDMSAESLVMRLFYRAIRLGFRIGFGPDMEKRPECRMMLSSSALAPLRTMQINGNVPGAILRALLFAANGFRRSKGIDRTGV